MTNYPMTKKVLIITYYWPPSGGAGVQRWVKFVKYLPDFGFEPIVLTVDPQYASYPVIDDSLVDEIPQNLKVYHTKSNEPFKFYKKVSGKSDIPHAGFANESEAGPMQKFSRFIRGNLFIPDARKGWNKFAYKKAIQLIAEHQIDTVITTSPPHSTQLIGLKLKTKLNIKWVADIRDPWTDIYYYDQLYHTALAKKIDKDFERKVLTNADQILVVSDAIKNQFLAKSPSLTENKFNIIPNGYDEDDFSGHQIADAERFIITYTGTLAANYSIGTFLKAVEKLSEELQEKKIALRFVGVLAENYKQQIENTSLGKITEFVGHVDHKASIQYLLKSTILFLAIPDVVNNEGILTGKLFEYLAAKKPILGVGPVKGDAARIIVACNAGEIFDYDDQDSIYNYLKDLHSKWIKQGNVDLQHNNYQDYSRKALTKKLVSSIEE